MNARTIISLAAVLTFGVVIGFVLGGSGSSNGTSGGDGEEAQKILYWIAPMDPNFRSDGPGKSPMGMDLIPVYEGDDNGGDDEGAVRISPATINNIGVRTAKVVRQDLGHEIETVGFIGYDDTKVSHVHMRAEGWIEELIVETEGERVKQGDLLFQLYSPTLVNAQSEYVQARKSGRTSLMNASKERLRALGFAEVQIDALGRSGKAKQLVDVFAQQDGVVVNLNVAENMYVTPGTTILTIADLSSVWVLADVFEEQAQWMKDGLAAKVRTPFLPGAERGGVVEYVYPTIDPVTRTLKVRLRFDNLDEALKPNMYAEVSISGRASANVLSIPRDALIRSGRSERVILALGDGRFSPVEVRAGVESGERVEILSGLEEGQDIVVSGQFLIDSEASLSASFRRMGEPEVPQEPEAHEMEKAQIDDAISAKGEVKAVMLDERKINLTHEPIPAIGWPTMTMDFAVTGDVDLAALQVGDSIHFGLVKNAEGMYVIGSIHVMKK